MTISELILELDKVRKARGDLNVYVAGHPGETGSKLEADNFEVCCKSNVPDNAGKTTTHILRIWT